MATAVGVTRVQSSYWRIAGLSFPKYANLTARVVRKSVKVDAARVAKLPDRDTEKMSFRSWTTLPAAGGRSPPAAVVPPLPAPR